MLTWQRLRVATDLLVAHTCSKSAVLHPNSALPAWDLLTGGRCSTMNSIDLFQNHVVYIGLCLLKAITHQTKITTQHWVLAGTTHRYCIPAASHSVPIRQQSKKVHLITKLTSRMNKVALMSLAKKTKEKTESEEDGPYYYSFLYVAYKLYSSHNKTNILLRNPQCIIFLPRVKPLCTLTMIFDNIM